jgi:hypothetical protein
MMKTTKKSKKTMAVAITITAITTNNSCPIAAPVTPQRMNKVAVLVLARTNPRYLLGKKTMMPHWEQQRCPFRRPPCRAKSAIPDRIFAARNVWPICTIWPIADVDWVLCSSPWKIAMLHYFIQIVRRPLLSIQPTAKLPMLWPTTTARWNPTRAVLHN